MEKDVLTAADHLRNQLGVFYWTIQHGGDLEIAAQQLQTAVCWTERETSPSCLCTPPTLFTRWGQMQLTSLLGEAKQVLNRVGQCPPARETIESVQFSEAVPGSENPEAFRFGPLA
jgi:hypothetical protein